MRSSGSSETTRGARQQLARDRVECACASGGSRRDARAAGFDAHLAKPVDPAELIQCVLECRRSKG